MYNSPAFGSLAERTWVPDQLTGCQGRESRDTNGMISFILMLFFIWIFTRCSVG